MGLSIEWLGLVECGILRQGQTHRSYERRDPYDFSCTCIRKDDTAWLLGAGREHCPFFAACERRLASKPDSLVMVVSREELRALLAAAGIRHCNYERHGQLRHHPVYR